MGAYYRLLPNHKTQCELLEYYARLGVPIKIPGAQPGACVLFLAELLRGSPANHYSTIARYSPISAPGACNSPKNAMRYHKNDVNSSI